MPMHVRCPSCDSDYNIADTLRGKKIRCKKCDGVFLASPARGEDHEDEDSPRRDRRLGSSPQKSAPARSRRDEDEDEDEDERPARRAKRSQDEDEDEERPRRRSGRNKEDEDDEDDQRSRKKNSKKGGSTGLLIGIIGGVFALLLLGGGLAFAFWPGKKADGPVTKNENPPEKKPPLEEKKPAILPAALASDDLKRVKDATVQLRAQLLGEGISQGTGFLAVEPGLIITNAHVLGMLTPNSLPPSSVQVIVHSGESNQFTTKGVVLGVDRTNDLAVIRADAASKPLPAPLKLDSATDLTETQKVYIFGFPFARQIGKNITVSESSVTSLRKKDGLLRQIQVKGGMNPGNSGGPVTDTRGVVVGVSVSIIEGTEINFAIPGDYVQQILAGGVSSQEFGLPYSGSGSETRMPVYLKTLDPLRRVREVKVDVWAGGPNGARLPSDKEPTPRAGESTRQRAAVTTKGDGFIADVSLPALGAGQVYWAQPVTVGANGSTRWGAAKRIPYDPNTILVRKPALLRFQVPTKSIERTVRITNKTSFSLLGLDEARSYSIKLGVHALEISEPDKKQPLTLARLYLHKPEMTREKEGKVESAPPEVRQFVSRYVGRLSMGYLIAPNYSVKTFSRVNLDNVPAEYQESVQDLFDLVCNAYEGATIPLPNREVKPQESWPAHVPMLISTGPPTQKRIRVGRRIIIRTIPSKKDIRALNITCTYEGLHTVKGVELAYIRFEGVANGIRDKAKEVFGKVSGYAEINLATGMVAKVRNTITLETESGLSGGRFSISAENTVERVEGNIHGIKPPTPRPPAGSIAGLHVGTNGAAKVISGDMNAFIQKAIKDKRISMVDLSGNKNGTAYAEAPPEGGLLIGFQVVQGVFGTYKVVHGLRAIYRTKGGKKYGAWHGKAPPGAAGMVTLEAKAGYAVSGINIRAGLTLDGISLTYSRLERGRVNTKQSYKSPWAGNTGGGSPSSVGGQGVFFVGIVGHVDPGGRTCSLGLVTVLDPKTDPGPPPGRKR